MKNWFEHKAKLFLVAKVENQERILLRFSSADARICASAAATH